MLNNWGPHLIDHALQFLDYKVADIWGDLHNVASLGDAEDTFKAILRGKNGCYVECEVSGGVALPEPAYTIHGSRGSLISQDESEIKLKYLEPKFKLPKGAKSSPLSPDLNASFGGKIAPKWVEKTIKVKPSNGWDMNLFYQHIWNALRKDIPFPVKNEEAFAVVKVIETIKKQNPKFKSLDDILK